MKKLREIWKANRWLRFMLVLLLYVLWFVVWGRSWWMLGGVLVIYDLYYSKYLDRFVFSRYRSWRASLGGGGRAVLEWAEALVYAMVVILPLKLYFFGMFVIPSGSMERSLLTGDYIFVDKWTYGPKMPTTPLSLPFVHNTVPFTQGVRSYFDRPQWAYKRLAGIGSGRDSMGNHNIGVRRGDVVIFNFPEGDTVALGTMRMMGYDGRMVEQDVSTLSYYDLVRGYGREEVYAQTKVLARPVDKRENYVKRCVAVAGDTLQVVGGEVYINGVAADSIPGVQYSYMVVTTGQIPQGVFDRLGLRQGEDVSYSPGEGWYQMSLNEANMQQIKSLPQVSEVIRYQDRVPREGIFPHRPDLYPWTEDFFGPLWVPKKGCTVELTMDNLPFYERIIKNYEGNTLAVDYDNDVIYVNGEVAKSYTFALDYYFMMGDNRHRSADSRYWGFVPEDHVEGKAGFVWLSIEPGKNIFSGVRWSRLFRGIN